VDRLMTDAALVEAENENIRRRAAGVPRLKKKKGRPRLPVEVGGNTSAADNTGAVSASEHKLSETLAKIFHGRPVLSAETRVLIESRLSPRGPDLTAAHAIAAERLQPRARIDPATVKLVEQARAKLDGRVSASGEDLNARMRKALVSR